MSNQDLDKIFADTPVSDPLLLLVQRYARRMGAMVHGSGNLVVVHTRDPRSRPPVHLHLEFYVDSAGELRVCGRVTRPVIPAHHVIGINRSGHWFHIPELRHFEVTDDGVLRLHSGAMNVSDMKSFHRALGKIIRTTTHVAWICQMVRLHAMERPYGLAVPRPRRSRERRRGMMLDKMHFELYRQRSAVWRYMTREELAAGQVPRDDGWDDPVEQEDSLEAGSGRSDHGDTPSADFFDTRTDSREQGE